MENAEYHAMTSHQSCSMLKVFYRDRTHYHRQFVTGEDPQPDFASKPQVIVGDLAHQVLLEKKDVGDLVAFYPDDCYKSNGTLNPRPAADFRERMQLQGKTVVKDDLFKRVVGVCNSVMSDDLGDLINRSDLTFEEPIFWKDNSTGLDCKAKPDFMYVDERHVSIWDLKVTESVSPSQWPRIAKKLMYWMQDAHYSSGAAHLYQKPIEFTFWVVESVPPHRIVMYQFDSISRERANEAYANTLRDLKECRDENVWSEDWEDCGQMIALDPWDVKSSEAELEGFDGETIKA
jgi:exodeoxyribonuclease VIII